TGDDALEKEEEKEKDLCSVAHDVKLPGQVAQDGLKEALKQIKITLKGGLTGKNWYLAGWPRRPRRLGRFRRSSSPLPSQARVRIHLGCWFPEKMAEKGI